MEGDRGGLVSLEQLTAAGEYWLEGCSGGVGFQGVWPYQGWRGAGSLWSCHAPTPFFPQANVVCMVYDVSEEATIEKVRARASAPQVLAAGTQLRVVL